MVKGFSDSEVENDTVIKESKKEIILIINNF